MATSAPTALWSDVKYCLDMYNVNTTWQHSRLSQKQRHMNGPINIPATSYHSNMNRWTMLNRQQIALFQI